MTTLFGNNYLMTVILDFLMASQHALDSLIKETDFFLDSFQSLGFFSIFSSRQFPLVTHHTHTVIFVGVLLLKPILIH